MQRVRVAGLAAVIVGLHALGFAALATGAVGVGLGLTAYTLGLRHAFDADHIAAIDGTTRKLMAQGERPVSVGFFFALGHATVVFVAALGLALGLHVVAGDGSALATVTGFVGPAVSVAFLFVIAALNLRVLAETLRALRAGGADAPPPGGPLTRLYARPTPAVRAPWQMYPLRVPLGPGLAHA